MEEPNERERTTAANGTLIFDSNEVKKLKDQV